MHDVAIPPLEAPRTGRRVEHASPWDFGANGGSGRVTRRPMAVLTTAHESATTDAEAAKPVRSAVELRGRFSLAAFHGKIRVESVLL